MVQARFTYWVRVRGEWQRVTTTAWADYDGLLAAYEVWAEHQIADGDLPDFSVEYAHEVQTLTGSNPVRRAQRGTGTTEFWVLRTRRGGRWTLSGTVTGIDEAQRWCHQGVR
jgi:hypothetical protein